MTTTRTAPALLALACAAGLLTAGAAPSTAAVVRCDGRVPTIVTSDRRVTGTPGDDVIVVLDQRASVRAGDGDDRICVRSRPGFAWVSGGPGDDRIRVETRTFVYADLRAGSDTYRGGPGTELVVSGWPGARNDDRVDLGGGRDVLVLDEGRDHRSAVLRGGAGDDVLRVIRRSGAIQVDTEAGTTSLDGRTTARWSSFESHEISSGGRQSFVGSADDDTVSFYGRGAIEASTGDGDDAVELRYDPWPFTAAPEGLRDRDGRHSPSILLDLGGGRDRLDVGTTATSVVGNLTIGRIDFAGPDGPLGAFAFAGVEDLSVDAPVGKDPRSPSRVELVGDDLDNEMRAGACHVVLRGAGGDDHLRVGAELPDSFISAGGVDRGCRRTSRVYGDLGDDTLVSQVLTYDLRGLDVGDSAEEVELPSRDLLDGGEGVDTADAGAGRDTCLAETRIACEA